MRGYVQKFEEVGASRLLDFIRDIIKKADCQDYKEALFLILHEPPSLYGINRTKWEMADLQHVMAQAVIPSIVKNFSELQEYFHDSDRTSDSFPLMNLVHSR